eukprot:m.37429 g.37429  ORF g.37429 m.37429 type:complete len:91 (+) comp6731_c0_seq1:284-556(+)
MRFPTKCFNSSKHIQLSFLPPKRLLRTTITIFPFLCTFLTTKNTLINTTNHYLFQSRQAALLQTHYWSSSPLLIKKLPTDINDENMESGT